jgi:hypothetical protein
LSNLTIAIIFDPELISEVPAPLQQRVRELAQSQSNV